MVTTEQPGFTFEAKPRGPESWVKKGLRALGRAAALSLAGTVTLMGAGVAVEAAQGDRPPSFNTMDSKEAYRNSLFIAVYFSGTGLETSQWAAANDQQLMGKYDGTVANVTYGNRLNYQGLLDAFVAWKDETYLRDTEVNVFFVADSAGGIVAQHVGNLLAESGRQDINLVGMLLQSTPGGVECVQGGVEQWLTAHIPAGTMYGKTPILLSNIQGIFDRGDNPLDGTPITDALTNTALTSSTLTSDQLAAIAEGFPADSPHRANEFVAYMMSNKDKVVDPECSVELIQQAKQRSLGGALISIVLIHPAAVRGELFHGSGWLISRHPYYVGGTESVAEEIQRRLLLAQARKK